MNIPTKPGRPAIRAMAIRRALSECKSPIGMNRVDLAKALNITPDEASNTVNGMRSAGTVYAIGQSRDMRYFATEQARDAAGEAYAAFLVEVANERKARKQAAKDRSSKNYKAKAKAERAERRAAGLHRTKPLSIGRRRTSILELLHACTNPLGMGNGEVSMRSGAKDNSIAATLRGMCEDGQAFSTGPHRWTRFFPTAEARDQAIQAVEAYVALKRAGFAENRRKSKAKGDKVRRARIQETKPAKPAKPRKVKAKKQPKPIVLVKSKSPKPTAPSFKNLPVVNEGQVKVQRLPGFTGDRWGVTGPVVGGFVSAGIGKYLEAA